MYWRTPDVRQITIENTFEGQNSIYSFVNNAIGKNYSELSDFAIEYFNKQENPKYFGQIISYINFLGLIELDSESNGKVKTNDLLEDIYNRVLSFNDNSLAKEYFDYYLLMWQFPTPNIKNNRDADITKPYILILHILQLLSDINEEEAYLNEKDFYRLFDSPSIITIEDVTNEYISDIISKRDEAVSLSHDALKRKVSYYGALLSESSLLTFNESNYPNSENFMFGLRKNIDTKMRINAIVNKYKDNYFSFDPTLSASDKTVIGKWSEWINDKQKFINWRRIKMLFDRVEGFYGYCTEMGFYYDKDLLRRFITSLEAKPFLILTGISGSGKTKIAELWAEYIGNTEQRKMHISVGSNWTDNKKLLGYKNIVRQDEYIQTQLVELIYRANDNEYDDYIVILDEMNLSHVERYFSDFLSALESLNHEIKLPDGKCAFWSHNLKIIGTVNIDETTYMFSPKVLDRANVIEMNASKPSKYIDEVIESDFKVYKKIREKEWFDQYTTILDLLFEALDGKLGYRVVDEISQYLKLNIDTFGKEMFIKSFDEQIMQKVLPKLHGSKAVLKPKLDKVSSLLNETEGFELSLSKIDEMNISLRKGYASYIGE